MAQTGLKIKPIVMDDFLDGGGHEVVDGQPEANALPYL